MMCSKCKLPDVIISSFYLLMVNEKYLYDDSNNVFTTRL